MIGAKPSRDQQAYEKYVAWCEILKVQPASYESWLLITKGIQYN